MLAVPAVIGAGSSCAPSGDYMGIDTTVSRSAPDFTPERVAARRMRAILMLIAAHEGCYERVPAGFRIVPMNEAESFECAERLLAIEKLNEKLGLPHGPAEQAKLELAQIARRASSGDKRAQLDLGIRFEEGIGVAVDLEKARKLYARAASASGGTIWVYSPPVGNGTSGRVIPVDQGPRQSGLAEAEARLAALTDGS